MENEIYQIYNSVIVQWFGLDIQHKTISLIPHTKSKCTIIPPDAYPINQLKDNLFKIETSHAVIIPKINRSFTTSKTTVPRYHDESTN